MRPKADRIWWLSDCVKAVESISASEGFVAEADPAVSSFLAGRDDAYWSGLSRCTVRQHVRVSCRNAPPASESGHSA
jgi:hypothetical protein